MTVTVSAPPPVILRASKRLVVGRLGIALVAGLLAVGTWLAELTWLPRLLGVIAVVQLVQALYSWAGRVILRPDGLRRRGLGLPRRMRWSQLWDCEVRTTLLGRHIRVRLLNPKRHIRLPAPSSPYLIPDRAFDDHVELLRAWCAANPEGVPTSVVRRGFGSPRLYAALMSVLLVVALGADRPWDWSASDGPLVASVSDLCRVAPASVKLVVDDQPGVHSTGVGRGETEYLCTWGVDDENRQMMSVEVDVYRRLGPFGATWRARDAFDQFSSAYDSDRYDVPMPIGDESVAVDWLSHNSVVARRANAIVQVYSHGPTDDVMLEAAMVALDATDGISVRSA